jgi:hypothetical protein
MDLIYKKKSIPVTTTSNQNILKYHFQKLYYAIIVKNCNRYSTIAHKQRIDVVLTDDNLNIVSFKKDMHENTFYENKSATTAIILPPNYFKNIEVNTNFILKESIKK